MKRITALRVSGFNYGDSILSISGSNDSEVINAASILSKQDENGLRWQIYQWKVEDNKTIGYIESGVLHKLKK